MSNLHLFANDAAAVVSHLSAAVWVSHYFLHWMIRALPSLSASLSVCLSEALFRLEWEQNVVDNNGVNAVIS